MLFSPLASLPVPASIRDKRCSDELNYLPGQFYRVRCAEHKSQRSVIGNPELGIDPSLFQALTC